MNIATLQIFSQNVRSISFSVDHVLSDRFLSLFPHRTMKKESPKRSRRRATSSPDSSGSMRPIERSAGNRSSISFHQENNVTVQSKRTRQTFDEVRGGYAIFPSECTVVEPSE